MNDYRDLLICVGILAALWLAPRLHVWHRCICGKLYCRRCGGGK